MMKMSNKVLRTRRTKKATKRKSKRSRKTRVELREAGRERVNLSKIPKSAGIVMQMALISYKARKRKRRKKVLSMSML